MMDIPVDDDQRYVSLTSFSNEIRGNDVTGDNVDYQEPNSKSSKASTLPINNCGLFSYAFLTWFSPLVWKVFRRKIENICEHDIWTAPEEEGIRENTEKLAELWERELQYRGPEKACVQRTWRQFTRGRVAGLVVITTVNAVAAFLSSAFLLYRVVSYLESGEADLVYGIGLTLAIAAAELVRATSITCAMVHGYQTGIRFRNAFIGLMYNKLLKMKAIDSHTKSEVISIFSIDSYRIFKLGASLVAFCTVPPYILLASVYCCILIHYWALVAIATFIICTIFQAYFSHLMKKFRKTTSIYTDKRVHHLREVLNNIKFIKMHAWEGSFTEKIKAVRQSEQSYLFWSAVVQCISTSVMPLIPTLATVITISIYSAAGNTLTAATVFALVGTLNFLRFVFESIPYCMRLFVEANVSMKRLKRLLILEEIHQPKTDCNNKNNRIEFKEASFVWGATTTGLPQDNISSDMDEAPGIQAFNLHGVNVEIKGGQLIGICGSVGSGKSSFISAILGRMHQTCGHLAVNGSLAYAGQHAWILNATVKENIVFGNDYDNKWFNQVIDACCLLPDIQDWQGGADTEIGERGVNLSGGQKQRINIARAIYSKREIYLLDDPLSAVDDEVGRRLFNECIKGLLRDKTVLLVTHQLHYLSDCDQVVVMDGGSILESGSHDTLVNNNGLYAKMFTASRTMSIGTYSATLNTVDKGRSYKYIESDDKSYPVKENIQSTDGTGPNGQTMCQGSLVTAEKTDVGHIGCSTYSGYIRAGGGLLVVVIVALLFLLSTGALVFADWWLSLWIDDLATVVPANGLLGTTSIANTSLPGFESIIIANVSIQTYAIVYAALIPILVLIQVVVGWASAKVMMSASNHMHQQCLTRLLMAPISFFNVTPAGRILNRFTRDLDETDVHLPRTLTMLIRNVCILVWSLIVVVLVSQWIIVLLVPAVLMFAFIRMASRRCICQIKRLENITRSPVISQVNATTQGLQTIVAFGKEEQFIKKFQKHGDTSAMATFLFDVSMKWVGLRLDLISVSITIGSVLLFVLSKGVISPAAAGLVLGLCAKNIGTIQFLTALLNDTEARFTSVERLREYGMHIPSETQTSSNHPSKHWPEKGSIVFTDVVMKYMPDSDDVLHSVSLDIRPREKIGVVGRTGGGKSSLGAVLFRLVEVTSGHVFIDGENIADLPLATLRSCMSSIPQDPVLFGGSIRYNIDPFSTYTDDDIWLSLEKVHMKEKILFLDEATANVDTSTDARIQETLRTCFANCTVINIAHRLNTLQFSDRIIVMDGGQVMEYGTPHTLMEDPQKSKVI